MPSGNYQRTKEPQKYKKTLRAICQKCGMENEVFLTGVIKKGRGKKRNTKYTCQSCKAENKIFYLL